MDPDTAQLVELEAYLRRAQTRLETLEAQTPHDCLQLAAIESALLPRDVGERLRRCRLIVARLLTSRRD